MRSILFCPASNARALAKLPNLPCDAAIIDLEDAVGGDAKEGARQSLLAGPPDTGSRPWAIRVNAIGSPDLERDLELVKAINPNAVVLPKAEDVGKVQELASSIGVPVWLMIETPLGVINAAKLAAIENVTGLILGPNDLHITLGARMVPGRLNIHFALQQVVLAARASGIYAFDGIYNDFKDETGFRDEAIQGRDLGFHGKTLIHPAQIGIANEVFAPSAEDLAEARAIIAAFEAGDGNAVQMDGRMIEELHVIAAQNILKQAAAIEETGT